MAKVITFEKSALRVVCKALKVPYDKDIIAFTKKGVLKKGIFSIVELADSLKGEGDAKSTG